MESYAFEDLLPKNWSSATSMKEINIHASEPSASFSKDQFENDFDFFDARRSRCSRLDGNFNAQNLIPEDVRDNSSLLSEESSSSTAVRGKAIEHSPSRKVTGEERRKHRNAFASTRNKCSTEDEKYRSMSNPSKQKSSHFSNSLLQEELGANNSWQFEERYASAHGSSVATSFCRDLERNFTAFDSKNRTEDPFMVITTPELHNKASPSFGGFKNAAPLADSSPCSFTPENFAFDCSTAFPNDLSWPTSPSLSPDFQFKRKPLDAGGFNCETSSSDMSVQGSVSKGERKVKLQKDTYKNFEQEEDIFMGDKELSSEKKMTGDAPTSNNHAQGTDDTDPKTTACLGTADSPGHVEEISSSLKKHDKHENQVDKRKINCDAETPLICKSTNEEMKNWQREERNTVSGKENNDQINLSDQVMFESYVFHLLRVQKVLLKGACTT
ncbi:uncharacterized protein LOC133309945 [Gastrolobium bilobum]|uniref:uncharacterized protein LOC133309945 n=1 Tax=Gastrolobium bilobum TaxID=150636 RepID=UPI002AB32566|nr:uncharacterized protein LOC133309945 [Gastrolobium bilobum]